MRRKVKSAILLLLGIGCVGISTPAQQPASLQNVTVVVVDAEVDPTQPVKAVRVSLDYLDSAVLITDAQDVTNSRGEALLAVTPDMIQRGDLRIEITGATGLVIYQPADGQLAALPSKLTVTLLPKGSTALLGPSQIEAMLRRETLQVNSLQKQNRALQGEIAKGQNQNQSENQGQNQTQDLSAAFAEWATQNGFSSAEVNQQVQQWAQDIQRRSQQATLQQKALAEVALKQYGAAAQLFDQAADADVEDLDAEEQALMDATRTKLGQLIKDREQSAGAYQLNLQYHQATQTLESAEATADAEYKKHPDDKGFHELRLQAVTAAADARWHEGEVSPASESLPLLAQSAGDFQSLAHEYTELGDRQEAAAAQRGLGLALDDEGERASGDKSSALLDQAVQAFQNALEVYTKTDLPHDWASTQVDLGGALVREGQRAIGDESVALLDQAVQAFQNALEVYTKADLPRYWARTQMDLGVALLDEGERASGDKSAALLDEAVQAFQNALQVYTKADLPQYWAMTQMNLVVANFAAAHFDACLQQAAILTDDTLSSSPAVIRDTVRLACEWGAGSKNATFDTEKTLLSKAATLQPRGWNFTGTLQFLSTSPAFAIGRPSWIAFFTSVQNGDSAGMTEALHLLEPLLQN